MKDFGKLLSTILVHGFWLAVISWIFFGPVWAFHYAARFGLTGYMIFNDEFPDSGGFEWNGHHVHFYWRLLGLAVLLWVLCAFAVIKFLKYMDSKAYLTG